MADQEPFIVQTEDKPNQINFGLTQTPENKLITYLLETGKPVSSAATLCNGIEHDPDYLPLVALRTRKVGEDYPYPAIQGYRTGNELEVVCYLQDIDARPLPPPARVICYLIADNVGVNESVFIENGFTIVGISGFGTLGYTSQWYDSEGLGISYKGYELIFQSDALTSWKTADFWAPAHYYNYSSVDEKMISYQTKTSPSTATQAMNNDAVEELLYNPQSYVSVFREFELSSNDILTIKTTITNISGAQVDNLYFALWEGYAPDKDGEPGETFGVWVHRVSDEITTLWGDRNPVAVASVCKSQYGKALITALYADNPGSLWSENEVGGYTTPTFKAASIGAVYLIPTIGVGESVELIEYRVFGDDEAAVIAKAATL